MEKNKFKFRKHASIGASAAEEDHKFLSECFVDTGDLSTLADCTNHARIVLGRTGTGKTALINSLAEKENAIVIRPESLSFNFLTRSTILQFFLGVGVKLDLFFKLLWRHVLTVELLKRKYHINNDNAKKSFLDKIKSIITRDKGKEKAIEYLLRWGDKFWEETEYRIKEITNKIEDELKASVGSRLELLDFSASCASKLTSQEKAELVNRGQSVINAIQMRELTEILDFLDEDVFTDEKQNFYVCIDKLDENWVDDRFRFLLIRSLIETVRDFQRVSNVKIVVALRNDLIKRVFRLTRDAGFQEEKYTSLYLSVRWTPAQLMELLNRRVNFLVRQTYTKKPVGCKDLLPSLIGGKSAISYMLERTLMRPRELIEFFNFCIQKAEGRPTITKKNLLEAEGIYSESRLRSLQDEWFGDYPTLIDFVLFLRKKPKQFVVRDLNEKAVGDFCLDYAIVHYTSTDELSMYAKNVAEAKIDTNTFLSFLFHVLYRTGVVGLKTETFQGFQHSANGITSIAAQTIDADSRVAIHPMFWGILGIKP